MLETIPGKNFIHGLKEESEKEIKKGKKETYSLSPFLLLMLCEDKLLGFAEPSCNREVKTRVTKKLNHSSIHWTNFGYILCPRLLVMWSNKILLFSQVCPDSVTWGQNKWLIQIKIMCYWSSHLLSTYQVPGMTLGPLPISSNELSMIYIIEMTNKPRISQRMSFILQMEKNP